MEASFHSEEEVGGESFILNLQGIAKGAQNACLGEIKETAVKAIFQSLLGHLKKDSPHAYIQSDIKRYSRKFK